MGENNCFPLLESTVLDNFSRIDEQVSAWVDAHRAEILETTQAILRIPSVEGEAAPGAPFGAETLKALNYALRGIWISRLETSKFGNLSTAEGLGSHPSKDLANRACPIRSRFASTLPLQRASTGIKLPSRLAQVRLRPCTQIESEGRSAHPAADSAPVSRKPVAVDCIFKTLTRLGLVSAVASHKYLP